MTQQVGPYVVGTQAARGGQIGEPNKKQVKRVEAALAAVDDDVNVAILLPLGCRVLYGWLKNVPGTNKPAIGYTSNRRTTRVRWDVQGSPNPNFESTISTILHETLGHARMAQVPLTADQLDRCLRLLDGPSLGNYANPRDVLHGVPGDRAKAQTMGISVYWFSPLEGIIDSMVPALSDVTPSWHSRYQRVVPPSRYDKLKAIWLEGAQGAPAAEADQADDETLPPDDALPELDPDPSLQDAQAILALAQQIIARANQA